MTSRQALTQITNEIGNLPLEHVIQFGLEVLNELRDQGVILGVYNHTL
jgi:hypothetical protein